MTNALPPTSSQRPRCNARFYPRLHHTSRRRRRRQSFYRIQRRAWCRNPPQHKQRFLAFLIQLFEKEERFLIHGDATLFVTVDYEERVFLPWRYDVVLFESGGEDFVCGVFYGDAETFEDVEGAGR